MSFFPCHLMKLSFVLSCFKEFFECHTSCPGFMTFEIHLSFPYFLHFSVIKPSSNFPQVSSLFVDFFIFQIKSCLSTIMRISIKTTRLILFWLSTGNTLNTGSFCLLFIFLVHFVFCWGRYYTYIKFHYMSQLRFVTNWHLLGRYFLNLILYIYRYILSI